MDWKKYGKWIVVAVGVALVAKPALMYVSKVLAAVSGLLPGV